MVQPKQRPTHAGIYAKKNPKNSDRLSQQHCPVPGAVQLSGARQVGKTTLLLQAIDELLRTGIRPLQILYVTFDHPLMKLIGLEGVLELWHELQPPPEGLEYLLLDEIQNTSEWPTWLTLQIDFQKKRRIAVTGSAIPINTEGTEFGVGRWHTIKLPTLSFFEYLQIKKIEPPKLPAGSSLTEIFDWSQPDRIRVGFSYWRGKKDYEVDIVAEVGGKLIPFEAKYSESTVNVENLKGLRMLCDQKKISRAYVSTRDMADFELCTITTKADSAAGTSVLKIPAPLACYWLSQLEHSNAAGADG